MLETRMYKSKDGCVAVHYREDNPAKYDLFSNIITLITSNDLYSLGYNMFGHRVLVTELGSIRVPAVMEFKYYPKHKRLVITYNGSQKRYKTVTLSRTSTLHLVKSFIERIFKEDVLYTKHYHKLRGNHKERYVDGNLIPKHIRYKSVSSRSWGIYGYNPFDGTLVRITSAPKCKPMVAPLMLAHSKAMNKLESKYRWNADSGIVVLRFKPE